MSLSNYPPGVTGNEPQITGGDDTTEAECRHCDRWIVLDPDGRWIDPEASGDDSVWRATCDSNHGSFIAAHEPATLATRLSSYLADVPNATPAEIREAVSEFLDRDPREDA